MDEYITNTAIPLLHFGLVLEQRVHNGLFSKLVAFRTLWNIYDYILLRN